MNKDNLLKLISGLPLTNVQNYGYIVLMTDVYDVCLAHGVDNTNLVVAWLEMLENDKLITLVRMKDSGYEDMAVGLTFPESS
ncbi:hypothetical protein [Paenibacillus terrae]|uniref:Uncharacterized protein n=1 Tax=Paenibacillus terrae TaxID=159743 RepID=A0A0D7WUS2_9BACL|nr:hypothetical protein [Paenibacillus terrae]KJD42468.1 hypothetical protein QD47_28050 [Paenibacillus terrae]